MTPFCCDRIVEGKRCEEDAEFKVKIGKLYGKYCGEHTLEFMRSTGYAPDENPIYPVDYEVGEGGSE